MLSRSHGQIWAMSAKLDITRAQAKALAAAAKAMNCIFEIERDGTIYRVIPEACLPAERPPPIDSNEDFRL